MKLWKIAATVAVGVISSGVGALQVNAAIYSYQVDFIDKEVEDFNDFRQSFNENTNDLQAKIEWTWTGTYYMDSCTSAYTVNMEWAIRYRFASAGQTFLIGSGQLPDFVCSTSPVLYTATVNADMPLGTIAALMDDDLAFIQLRGQMRISTGNLIGTSLRLENYSNYFNVYYEFNNTYLFNYFLSDQQFIALNLTTPGEWTLNATQVNYLKYLYSTAGNDTFIVENSLLADISNIRKKYAVNVDDIYFRGESVGAQFETSRVFGVDTLTPTTIKTEVFEYIYNYYYLNVSNYQQPIENVPDFEYEYEDCGSFLALNVPCFINNGIAYVVNDAPVISDAFTLLNAGMKLGGQAFGIIGQFTDNNLFGVLILGGMGITAVRWFLKND